MYAYPKAEAVEYRHRGQHLVAYPVDRVCRDYLTGKSVEVEVGKHYALGDARGSSGVEDGRRVIRLSADLVLVATVSAKAHEVRPLEDRRFLRDLLYLAALCQHVADPYRSRQLVPDAGNDDILYLRIFTDGLYLVIELVERDHHHGIGHVEVVLYLFFRAERVHHVGDRSHQVDRIKHVDSLRAVRHGDGDPVVLAYAQYSE